MKRMLMSLLQFGLLVANAQKGDELLVYSLTGNITVLEDTRESKLKIGKVLKPGVTIKTQPRAKLTMVCKQGKPISVTREGSFPINRWKDSCKVEGNSVTTKYFQYIWDQLYVRSDDYKKDHPNPESTPDAPIRGQEDLEIDPLPGLDTLHFTSGNFWLSWTINKPYTGNYLFSLYSFKSQKQIFKDSVSGGLEVAQLKKFMRVGNNYYWTVSAMQTGEVEGGVIKFHTKTTATRHISKLKKMVNVPEDLAAQNFRIAFLLEETRYTADAMLYYEKAAAVEGDSDFYKEMLGEFRKKFNISEKLRN